MVCQASWSGDCIRGLRFHGREDTENEALLARCKGARKELHWSQITEDEQAEFTKAAGRLGWSIKQLLLRVLSLSGETLRVAMPRR